MDPASCFADWAACAVRGSGERAARASRAVADSLEGRVAALGTAGHVLDFDDTYLPGLAHLSAPVAPAALTVAAETEADVGAMLDAYASGVEAMGVLSRASHPALYDGGWHPTAVTGVVGAATAAAHLLDADPRTAAALGLLRAGGLRAAFGSDGKSLQVGLAAASGVRAARLAAAGAEVDAARIESGPAGFEEAFAATFAAPADDGEDRSVFPEMWIKAYPCCLQTHGTIEAVLLAAGTQAAEPGDSLTVVVHPVSRRAAALDDVTTGLEAKFSIPYLAAFALRRGVPGLAAFAAVDEEVRADAHRIVVETDDGLLESEARVFDARGREVGRVEAALGSPRRPLDAATLAAKVRDLGQGRLDGALDEPSRPAADLLDDVWSPSVMGTTQT